MGLPELTRVNPKKNLKKTYFSFIFFPSRASTPSSCSDVFNQNSKIASTQTESLVTYLETKPHTKTHIMLSSPIIYSFSLLLSFSLIYVHADPFSKVSNPDGIFKDQFIPGKKTERGSPSLISAEKRLLARAILDDPFNLHFALVSQHCVPLHSFQYMYNTLFHDQWSDVDVPCSSAPQLGFKEELGY